MSDNVQPSRPDLTDDPSNRRVADDARIRLAVVFGGRSTEHAVSCVTAGSVLAAVDRTRYDVVPIGISHDGRWVLAPDEPEKLAITGRSLPEVADTGTAVVLTGDPTQRGLVVQEPGQVPRELGDVDVVLPLLHGPYGEDGTIQGLLELSGIPYVGSGVFASAAAMDKGHMKALLKSAGLPVGAYAVVTPREWERDPTAVRETVAALGYPVFVKPARAGSSVGITKVRDAEELDPAVEEARRHDPRVVVEAAIDGREIECGVLEGPDGSPEASVPGEIVVGGEHEFYDFEAKYLPDEGTELVVPADLQGDVVTQVQDLACRSFEALGCESLARVDFFVRADGTVIVNEVNTMPGFTPVSMFPLMWKASGLDYPALIDRLVQSALRRSPGLR